MRIHSFSAATFIFATLLLLPAYAFAATQSSVKIEQLSPGLFGTWTLLSANGTSISSADPGIDKRSYSFGQTELGPTTLSITPPAGMSVTISVYRGGELVTEVHGQQYSFTQYANDNYRLLVQYASTKLGSLGITSDPSGVRFRMKGPTRRIYSGRSARTFNNLPAGRYSIYFSATKDCLQPPVHTVNVEPGLRNTAFITFTCNVTDEAEVDSSRISKRTLRENVLIRELKPRGNRK